jgi:hypothetical protein
VWIGKIINVYSVHNVSHKCLIIDCVGVLTQVYRRCSVCTPFTPTQTFLPIQKMGMIPLRKKTCCGLLSPLKIYRFGRVFNPRTSGPVASTLTITLQRRLLSAVTHKFDKEIPYIAYSWELMRHSVFTMKELSYLVFHMKVAECDFSILRAVVTRPRFIYMVECSTGMIAAR